jgi:hypothetical protein
VPVPAGYPEPESPVLETKPVRRTAEGGGDLPTIFDSPTARFLRAGVILGSGGVDTGGGVKGDLRVGLGDVAEFGVGTNSLIRVIPCSTCDVEELSFYPSALFKMGLRENLLFRHQPALALGFRKSFTRSHHGRETKVAKLYLVASKRLHKKVSVHAGGVFWDASIAEGDNEVLLHDRGIEKQLRAFGGVEIEPLPRSRIMLEVDWIPEFRVRDGGEADHITLRPMFSWGVRYQLADWAIIESGVRIPDIENINLIDAQIFGQFRFISNHFSHLLSR